MNGCDLRLVFGWLTSGHGGAEASLEILAASAAQAGADVEVVAWSTGTARHLPRSWTVARDRAAYRQALLRHLDGAPGTACLVGSHRTAAVDLEVAGELEVPSILIVRALLRAGSTTRSVAPGGGELEAFDGADPTLTNG